MTTRLLPRIVPFVMQHRPLTVLDLLIISAILVASFSLLHLALHSEALSTIAGLCRSVAPQ